MISGFIIAGGKSSRMGGQVKCLEMVGGRPLLAHVMDRFAGQVDQLVLNTNEPADLFSEFEIPVIADGMLGQQGPLAGLLACLDYAASLREPPDWIVTVPSDCPFIPRDLVARLLAAAGDHHAVVAASADRTHPLAGIWRPSLRPALRKAFGEDGVRSMMEWVALTKAAIVEFDIRPVDPFFNVNEPADLSRAEELAALL